jgi:acyl transferase domain-containing protein
MSSLGFLSPDGKCQSFDSKANGYSRGEGFGVVVLKRLSDAVRDGNTIRAVIRATATGSDGKTPSITQPKKIAQMDAIYRAYEQAGLELKDTNFFEAHGTGTTIGDSTEASAIATVFSKYRSESSPLYVGALKSNIGHLEGAAGIVSVIKTVLSLEQGVIPPNIWFDTVNPNIPAKAWNLKFPTSPIPWPKGLRRASLNAMGFGGSNCHMIIDDALHYLKDRDIFASHRTIGDNGQPSRQSHALTNGIHSENHAVHEQNGNINGSSDVRVPNGCTMDEKLHNGHITHKPVLPPSSKIFIFSASDEAGIERMREVYQAHLTSQTNTSEIGSTYFDDLQYTLASRRSAFPWRSFTLASSIPSLLKQLSSPLTTVRSNPAARLAFIFTGQGAQWYAMGRELLAYSAFKESLQEASAYLQGLNCPWLVIGK